MFSTAIDDIERVRELLPLEVDEEIKQKQRATLFSGRKKQALLFESDYTALLISLASGVRTGLDPLEALLASEQLFQENSPIRDEVKKLRQGIEKGRSFENVIQNFASSIDHPDLRLFRSALLLSYQEGGSLAACLQRLARVTRHRQSFRRKTRAALVLQKISAIGITGCSAVILVSQFLMNSEAAMKTLHHPLGIRLIIFGSLLMLFGTFWMLKMCRVKV